MLKKIEVIVQKPANTFLKKQNRVDLNVRKETINIELQVSTCLAMVPNFFGRGRRKNRKEWDQG